MNSLAWLPDLILQQPGENQQAYLDRVYQVFAKDFLQDRPKFQGNPLGLRLYMPGGVPVPNGKEATFWHLMSDGPDELNRIPDIARCERMGWVKSILDHVEAKDPDVRVWEQPRQGKRNYGISIPTFEYVLFLGERQNANTGLPYTLPLSAYPVERQRRREKYQAEWEQAKIVP